MSEDGLLPQLAVIWTSSDKHRVMNGCFELEDATRPRGNSIITEGASRVIHSKFNQRPPMLHIL